MSEGGREGGREGEGASDERVKLKLKIGANKCTNNSILFHFTIQLSVRQIIVSSHTFR